MENEEEPKLSSTSNLELDDASGVLSKNGKSVSLKKKGKKNEKPVSDGAESSTRNSKSGRQFIENATRQNQQYTSRLQRALYPQNARGKSSPSTAPAAVNERLQPPQNLAIRQPQAPNFYYPVGYPAYPSFSGSWDPSIWWGPTQPLLFPGMSNYPRGSYGFASSQSWPMPVPNCVASSSGQPPWPMPVPNCVASSSGQSPWPMPVPNCVASSSGQPPLRGVIKPLKKLPQKHQKLWEAQSAENVQLWNMVGQLQGELADCKDRLIKCEEEISSLRSAATNEPAVKVGNGGTMVRGQPAKQGRSKRAIAPVGSQPPLQHQTWRRKPAIGSLKKVDDKDKDFTSLNTTEQDKNEGISATIIRNNGTTEIEDATLKMPTSLGNRVVQQFPEIQSRGIEFKSPSLLKSNNEGISSEDSKRNASSIASRTIYTNGNVSRQGLSRRNFKVKDKAAESGFPAVGHKYMADEFSSGSEEIETQSGSSSCGK